jgi:hypothetical protein
VSRSAKQKAGSFVKSSGVIVIKLRRLWLRLKLQYRPDSVATVPAFNVGRLGGVCHPCLVTTSYGGHGTSCGRSDILSIYRVRIVPY